MTETAPPAWAGFAGWFGLVTGLVCLMNGAAAPRPLALATLALFACQAYGVVAHLQGRSVVRASTLRASLARTAG